MVKEVRIRAGRLDVVHRGGCSPGMRRSEVSA